MHESSQVKNTIVYIVHRIWLSQHHFPWQQKTWKCCWFIAIIHQCGWNVGWKDLQNPWRSPEAGGLPDSVLICWWVGFQSHKLPSSNHVCNDYTKQVYYTFLVIMFFLSALLLSSLLPHNVVNLVTVPEVMRNGWSYSLTQQSLYIQGCSPCSTFNSPSSLGRQTYFCQSLLEAFRGASTL